MGHLSYWLPVLVEALDEVNETLTHRRTPLPLNGKEALLLRALLLSQELLSHAERLNIPLPERPLDP